MLRKKGVRVDPLAAIGHTICTFDVQAIETWDESVTLLWFPPHDLEIDVDVGSDRISLESVAECDRPDFISRRRFHMQLDESSQAPILITQFKTRGFIIEQTIYRLLHK